MKNTLWIAGIFLRKNILVERTVAFWLRLENLNSNIVVWWNYTIQTSSYWKWNLALGKWLHYSSVSYSLNKSTFVAQPRIWIDKCLTPFALRLGMLPKPSCKFKSNCHNIKGSEYQIHSHSMSMSCKLYKQLLLLR